MSVINDDIILAILTTEKNDPSIHIHNWHIENIADNNSNNYSSELFRIRVQYFIQKEENTPLKEKFFFLKAPLNTPLHEKFKTSGFYRGEIVMYAKVLPQMYTLEAEYFTPRQYYFNDEMLLVLEDLSQSGFKCADRVEKLDIEHCILALKCLAKFHAMSVKLEMTGGIPESVKNKSFFGVGNGEVGAAFITQQVPMFIDSVPQHLADQYPNLITYLKNLTPEMVVNSLNHSSSGEFNVLNHGDLQINNIMFRYDKYEIVEKVKFIDFQVTWWGSPAYDLMYFAITCMNFEDYIKYFPLLLRIYVRTLNKILCKLHCPTYDMQNLPRDVDTLFPNTLFVLSCLLPYILCDPDEPVDIRDACKTDQLELSCSGKAYKQKFYREISAKWFEYFAKNGTLRIKEEDLSNGSSDDLETRTQNLQVQNSQAETAKHGFS